MLAVDTLSSLLFQTERGNQLINQLNNQLRSLVKNDNSLLDGNSYSPTLWECKWLNDHSIQGYGRGAAVWMNTQTPYDVLNTRYNQIERYVLENSILKQMYSRIEKDDQSKINDLFIRAIQGTASKAVPAIYCLGDITQSVQIRVSMVDGNKAPPTDDTYWYDFYNRSDMESNMLSMMQYLDGSLLSSLAIHQEKYHPEGITEERLDSLGFFKRLNSSGQFNVEKVKCQDFYDHMYCESMLGFDYVVKWRRDATTGTWSRKWKSGYLEQGGIASNNGSNLIRVNFLDAYDYPAGQKFYQDGYTRAFGTQIDSNLPSNYRYVFSIAPVLNAIATSPYPDIAYQIDNTKIYCCADATDFSQNGFSTVNLDTTVSKYSSYNWNVAGYTVN